MTPLGGRRWAIVYALLGLTIAAFALAHLVVETHDVLVHQALYAVISVLASAAILYHAHRHRRDPFPASRYRRINAWLLATTFLLSVAGIVGLYVGSRRVEPVELFESAQLLVHVGLALGLHVGTTEATALENAAAAARSRTLETEREHRELLLGLLRHYILNGLTVIEGYADRLAADLEDPQREWAETIQHRAANTADVLDNAALLLRTEGADAAIRPAAVGDHLVRECERSSPEGVSVAAATDFRPLGAHADYQKAVELLVTGLHQAIEDPGRITVEQAGDTISITASPAQVPEHLEAELEEPIGSDVGLPLFLATELFAPAIELAVRTPGPETLAIDLACSIAEGDVDGTSTRTRH